MTALSGYPGAGKTHRRTTDPKLKHLPQLDVADYYFSHPGIHSNDAFALLLSDLGYLLNRGQSVVVETTLFVSSIQRTWLELTCRLYGAELTYIDLLEEPQVCWERVKKQQILVMNQTMTKRERQSQERYFSSRLRLLEQFLHR